MVGKEGVERVCQAVIEGPLYLFKALLYIDSWWLVPLLQSSCILPAVLQNQGKSSPHPHVNPAFFMAVTSQGLLTDFYAIGEAVYTIPIDTLLVKVHCFCSTAAMPSEIHMDFLVPSLDELPRVL
jgi:hypothetical protein